VILTNQHFVQPLESGP